VKTRIALLGLFGLATACIALGAEGPTPSGMQSLDNVFLIMMENHGYGQVVNNPNDPFVNVLISNANIATNYFAIAHPSLTNYLEIVGGLEFRRAHG
jgi:hypothetical protein